jgi:hypothetical protein
MLAAACTSSVVHSSCPIFVAQPPEWWQCLLQSLDESIPYALGVVKELVPCKLLKKLTKERELWSEFSDVVVQKAEGEELSIKGRKRFRKRMRDAFHH